MFEKKPSEAIINLLVFGYCQIKDLLIKLGSMGIPRKLIVGVSIVENCCSIANRSSSTLL
jgi:hypothetical protein